MVQPCLLDPYSDYVRSTDAELAEPWQLEFMRSFPWPAEVEPTVETYRRMRAALATIRSVPRTGERPKTLRRPE